MRTPAQRVTRTYEKAIGVLIWLAFAAAGIGILYGLSFLAGD